MRMLFIGDISGPDGIRAVEENVRDLKQKYNIDYVMANGENASNGRGLTVNDYKTLCDAGVDFFTMGNHTWFYCDYGDLLIHSNIIRPANIDSNSEYSKYGVGYRTITINGDKYCFVNLLGQSVKINRFEIINPFQYMENLLNEFSGQDIVFIIDFHSETTSEKNAFFLKFKGRVCMILGTHTHVQTADEKIVNGTGYITDAGMTGSCMGVIGAKPDSIINMFEGKSDRFRLEPNIGNYQFNGIIFDIDNKQCTTLERVFLIENNELK